MNCVVVYRKSTDLIWAEADTSISADDGSHSAEAGMTTPPTQDKAAEEMPIEAAATPTGMCLYENEKVKVLMMSYAAAPEPGTNLLAEIEAELAEFVAPGEDINLPVEMEVPKVIRDAKRTHQQFWGSSW